ncbi:SDR family oxidoreductase [Candidatus Nitrosocosmicus arcticus]|uniref:Glucose/ribitol dehydrogenase family protein/short chain alcohol dehydrogenase n=1 Tax=Candidatus Nitrosocosmicus arcticus TaxID=2035267 RepID=A0A557STB8_9ARCH|nr:SDR family NAD(P)-dependent oxidoreductase [Candidatus Nitrosocosmicus arcticus]TVP39857.1 glucose/ribitol dehydrogenase family protein/short chain alcohol dehydrogenase [Candidatus Nitrosocosmicus arcticus]
MNKSDKTILVTGSGTGIGQAVARKYAKSGYNIIILGRRKEPLIEASKILKQIITDEKFESSVTYYPGVDVSDFEAINAMFDKIGTDLGQIDIIVNNAGVSGPVKIFTNSSYQEFKDCVSIHLTGTFWTSIKALEVLSNTGKIITISTFFTEENKYEQRPYRFRTPYTAAQGAKNRLSECLSWELVDEGIKVVATNPGPVHSDRIYKTVYPKAAAEFLRVGGFPGLSHKHIEEISAALLPYLGDEPEIIDTESKKIATSLAKKYKDLDPVKTQHLAKELLAKIQEIAEKVQNNTKKMIVDNEFLSQEDVAEMVHNLGSDEMSKLLNGKVIPNDRVFYPVKPIVERTLNIEMDKTLEDKTILITTTSTEEKLLNYIKKIAAKINGLNVKQLIVLTHTDEHSLEVSKMFEGFHHHAIDLGNEVTVKKIFNTINSRYGRADSVIHFTGSYDYDKKLTSLDRKGWDNLVDNFVNIPHLVTTESVLSMTTHQALDDPSLFKGAKGNIVIVGPNSPVGKKVGGEVRARSEVFRGALRPYVTTANQELHDVLNSDINLTLVLPGNINGDLPDYDKMENSLIGLCSQESQKNNLIYYIDE